MRGGLWAALVATALLSTSALARAQCTKDLDCKGDRICEDGRCMAPPPPVAPAPPPDAPAPPTSAPAPAEPPLPAPPAEQPPAPAEGEPAAAESAAARAERERFFDEQPPPAKPRMHSPGMLVGGIVLTSLAPIVFYAGVLSNACGFDSSCDNDQALLAVSLTSLVLLGVGIPLIVTGARREKPPAQVTLGPWLSPEQAGLRLHLRL